MPQIIAKIEVVIEKSGISVTTIKAEIQLEGRASYTVSLTKSFGHPEIIRIDSTSQEPATAWLTLRLKQLVDEGPSTSTIKVPVDSLNLLPKITYRCSSCQAKLFESWGISPAIRIICRKCKTLGIPKAD